MAKSIFRKESLDKVNSPEQLNDYIKTSRPSAWLIILAAIVLLVSVIVWGIFGNLTTTVTANGIAANENVTCYMADVSSIQVGNEVTINGITGKISSISEKPLSLAKTQEQLNVDEYTLYCLSLNEWNYVVEISLPGNTTNGFVTASIVTKSVKPISFVLG